MKFIRLLVVSFFALGCCLQANSDQMIPELPPVPAVSALEQESQQEVREEIAKQRYVLSRINDARIQAYEKQIEALFKKNSWMRWGLAGVGAAAAVGGLLYWRGAGLKSVASSAGAALPLLGGWFNSNKGVQPAVPIVPGGATQESVDALSKELAQMKHGMIEANQYSAQQLGKIDNIVPAPQQLQSESTSWLGSAKNAVGSVAGGVNNVLFGVPGDFANKVIYGSFTGVGSSLLMAGVMRGASPLQNLFDGVYHDGDIKWYLTKHTTTKATVHELLSLAHDIALASEEYERESARESFVHLYQKFIMCYEQILAFMMYKNKQNLAHPYVAKGIEMSANHMRQDAEQFTNYLEDVVNETTRYVALPALVQRFQEQIDKRIKTYIQYENFLNQGV